ncbi:DUF6090 family protein [Winogradskyella immobilis]|uniref:Uncharacterized protein n=1 Tax=Winogradskyella immobilis TaxID=2816852 RepID=A0ABS8EMQ4_9FLAO|nr:DUF6090 family protein [Winogradskyella immobilis]MCC1484486.1 hypothetical protein [Winogradskyella immobilis]MCG0016578.1 hypothetical protein [Winogradskyella immobilis]
MIKFFRKIRQTMIKENKFSKYLLYAIGEIILVVIGILIALQINNNNEHKQQKQLERSLLLEMKENLALDLSDIRSNIDADTKTLRSNEIVLTQLENKLPFHDSLRPHYGQLSNGTVLVKNSSAYENLKTFGVNLISNDELRRKITNLYTARYDYLDGLNNRISNEFLLGQFRPMLFKALKSKSVLVDAAPYNLEELYTNNSFLEVLKFEIFLKHELIALYKQIEKEIIEIQELIDKELKND